MPTAEDRNKNITKVITASICCFREYGIVDTTQIMIAKDAQLSPRSIQRYFSSKTELVKEVVKYVLDDYCNQLANMYMDYDFESHTGLENLVYLINLLVDVLEHNIELFVLLDEAGIFLRHQKVDRNAVVSSILSVGNLCKLFEDAFNDGVTDKSIRKDIDLQKEKQLLHFTLTGLLYQFAAHCTDDVLNNSRYEQRKLLKDFINVWKKNLKSTSS